MAVTTIRIQMVVNTTTTDVVTSNTPLAMDPILRWGKILTKVRNRTKKTRDASHQNQIASICIRKDCKM